MKLHLGLNPLVTELGLILAESNTRNFAALVLMGESRKDTLSTSNFEQAIVVLKVEFLVSHGQLVVLGMDNDSRVQNAMDPLPKIGEGPQMTRCSLTESSLSIDEVVASIAGYQRYVSERIV